VSGRDDDRPSWHEREKKSFSELDRQRRERRDGREPRPASAASQARTRAATERYLDQIDGLFSSEKGGAEGGRLAQAVRDARGSAGLAGACRAYAERVGPPAEARLIECFLEADERDVVLVGLEALRVAPGREVSAGIRTQLRMLAEHPDDDVASAAEALLERG
jgi:hypothetical protein